MYRFIGIRFFTATIVPGNKYIGTHGKTNKEIGKDIGLSEASIKKHRAKLDRQRFEDSINIL